MTGEKRIIRTIRDRQADLYPYWFMRQAGRYLPEYRAVREKFTDFLSFCYEPDAAAAVTLQPIARFQCDAAIIFSDILVIPDALGQRVHFDPGHGPQLDPLDSSGIDRLRMQGEHLQPVYQAIRQTRRALDSGKALIGFAGAPWTLACYMLEGRGSKDFAVARRFAYSQPEYFAALIARLTDAVSTHLIAQIEAGADMVQLFDSWAGVLPPMLFQQAVIEPTRQIVAAVKARYPSVPIIGFPRGAGAKLADYAAQTGVDAVGVDTATPLDGIATQGKAVQGHLDPVLLASDGEQTMRQVHADMQAMRGVPYVVNLGHGILPDTPLGHVEALCDAIHRYRESL